MARNQKQQREASEFEERVVYINRVSKTVKGGRCLLYTSRCV